MDLNLLCRLCAKEDRLCIQVFGAEGKKQNVAKKIRLCLPIIVKESDDFPKQICLNCLSNLDTSYELYTRCLEAQSVIKNIMVVNRQSNGEIVRVYSTQEMLQMVNELRDKISSKRPALRLENTVFTIRNTGSQTEDSSADEQRAKKRKQDAINTAGRSMMYPLLGSAGPIAQPYMLMPSATMPPTMMIPSQVPPGQFAIAPLPAIQPYPITQMQAVPQAPISTAAPANVSSAANPQVPKVTEINSSQIAALPSVAAAQIASVQPVQHAPRIQNVQTATTSLQGSAPKVQQTSTANIATMHSSAIASESVAQPKTNIQGAIQAFQNSLIPARVASVQTAISSPINSASMNPQSSSSKVIPVGKALQNSTSNPSAVMPQIAAIHANEKTFQQAPVAQVAALQASTASVKTKKATGSQQPLSELQLNTEVGLSSDEVVLPDLPAAKQQSETKQETKPIKIQTASVILDLDGDDNDEYAVDDPDPLQHDDDDDDDDDDNDAGVEMENITIEEEDNSTTKRHNENRDTATSNLEELNNDDSAAGDKTKNHQCPYCKKYFPDDVIFHHKKLHFRQKFFSCITCNKNFRTEAGLETHRCE